MGGNGLKCVNLQLRWRLSISVHTVSLFPVYWLLPGHFWGQRVNHWCLCSGRLALSACVYQLGSQHFLFLPESKVEKPNLKLDLEWANRRAAQRIIHFNVMGYLCLCLLFVVSRFNNKCRRLLWCCKTLWVSSHRRKTSEIWEKRGAFITLPLHVRTSFLYKSYPPSQHGGMPGNPHDRVASNPGNGGHVPPQTPGVFVLGDGCATGPRGLCLLGLPNKTNAANILTAAPLCFCE